MGIRSYIRGRKQVDASRAGQGAAKSVDDWLPKTSSPMNPAEKQAEWNSNTAKKRKAGTDAWEAKYAKSETPTTGNTSLTPTMGGSGRTGTDPEYRM
jgi:hypothetical protein